MLDWLSTQFIAGGWHVKPLVKLMMVSTAYRQASQRAASAQATAVTDPEAIDPGNELLWRMRLRQMESESVRDAMLAASGKLEDAIGGPPIMIEGQLDGTVVVKKDGTPAQFSEPPQHVSAGP